MTTTETIEQTPSKFQFVDKTEATAKLVTPNSRVVTVIGTPPIRDAFEAGALQQIVNIADAPGIDEAVLNPDGHVGYGCPVGSVFTSREMIYPNAVGPDVKCSMSFLMFNIPAEALADKKLRRALINAIEERVPTGPGNHMPKKARPFEHVATLENAAIFGASSKPILDSLGIPAEWAEYCEDASHGSPARLADRMSALMKSKPEMWERKLRQLGGVGGGNHFMECNVVNVQQDQAEIADAFGLVNGNIGFLNHFGSRGFGFTLTSGQGKGGSEYPGQFRILQEKFGKWHIPFPGGEDENVYAPLGSPECDTYLDDMALGANFATVNHLLVCTYVMEAFTEVLGDTVQANLVYYIAHNIIRREVINDQPTYVHRKGATRALWAGHHELKDTKFFKVGHPVLLPGNPRDGSTIMVGLRGSRKALQSVNHGAGRTMSRSACSRAAKDHTNPLHGKFKQVNVNAQFEQADIITNCGRGYPVDEAPGAYKDYDEVIESVVQAGLAKLVARLKPVINIKDSDTRAETSA